MVQRETTYAAQIASFGRQIVAIEQQIVAETDLIDSIKRPGALLQALMSARVRQDALHESYRSRGHIAQLERDLAQARSEQDELKRLRMLYPEHDRLIEQAAKLKYQSWSLSLQEDEFDLEQREAQVAERLEEKRLQEENRRVQEELDELARQQEKLTQRQLALKKKRAAREASSH